jgi:hypothetical protein
MHAQVQEHEEKPGGSPNTINNETTMRLHTLLSCYKGG